MSVRPGLTSEEREAAIDRLSAAFAHDILTLDEFERRVTEVYRAATTVALIRLTEDLPQEAAGVAALATNARGALASTEQLSTRVSSVFSSVERRGRMIVPSRLELRAVFGNLELDLREAEFGTGITEIRVRSLFGNVEVRLPENIAVENQGGAFAGSFAVRPTGESGSTAMRAGTVRITGRAILGNVEFDIGG